jgi:4-hydroxy-tetrahydrodipicolinate synthase
VTCFDNHNQFDAAAQCKLIDYCYQQQNCDGITVCASTGEGLLLNEAEYWEVAKTCLDYSRKNYPNKLLILSTTHFDPMVTLEKNRRALHLGFDAVLVTYPPYVKPDQRGIKAYFRFLAEQTPTLPIIMYNIYYRTGGKGMDPQTLVDLAKIPNIVGVKDCGITTLVVDEVISGTAQDNFVYLCGEDDLYFDMLTHGARGTITASGQLLGASMKKMLEHMKRGEHQASLEIFRTIAPKIKLLFSEPNPAAIKAALTLAGITAGDPRLPLLKASEGLVGKLKSENCVPLT